MNNIKPRFSALLPLIFFFTLYICTWLLTGDLSNMPISVAFLLTIIIAFFTFRGHSMTERVEVFCKGAANDTILLMVLIFILAGAFAGTARAMGAVDATVNMALTLLPSSLIIASIFIAACFVSMAMGTSTGTIAALAPIAIGLAHQTGYSLPFVLGVVVGGAMFGDSLSFISDTTIVATRTQGCELKDKFRVNIRILYPITILLILIYVYIGWGSKADIIIGEVEWIKVLPYCVVLVAAIAGMNVIAVLVLGTLLSGIIGIYTDSLTIWGWAKAAQNSIVFDMGELIIVSLMAGGLFEIIRQNGGVDWLINKLTRNITSKRKAEASVAALVSITDMCTANNTVALIITGPIAKNIGDRFNIDNRRMASLIDTFSCSVQGFLPYGAQLLIASSLAGVAPVSVLPYLYYPVLMGLASILAIILQRPRKYTQN
ncbi:Na+/H+ antiporter NhaC family protein [Dysgonomonas sp. OttesenSCG-928-M03]|nr:Na+/H+ antiporter NhaC family protein [Dysgonomonas sp. OttesenSCG-928-M03]